MAKKKKTAKKRTTKVKTSTLTKTLDSTVSKADYLRTLIRLTERYISPNSDGTDVFSQQTARLKKELEDLCVT